METKRRNKINYGSLVKSSRELVKNTNFRNNQNYIISDFSKFKFYRSYYKNWFNKNLWFLISLLFCIGIFAPLIFKLINIFYWFEIILGFGFYITLLFIFVLLMFSIIFDSIFYYFYKKFSFIFWKQKFTSDRYIFFKNPKKNAYRLNRRDFISFKK